MRCEYKSKQKSFSGKNYKRQCKKESKFSDENGRQLCLKHFKKWYFKKYNDHYEEFN